MSYPGGRLPSDHRFTIPVKNCMVPVGTLDRIPLHSLSHSNIESKCSFKVLVIIGEGDVLF